MKSVFSLWLLNKNGTKVVHRPNIEESITTLPESYVNKVERLSFYPLTCIRQKRC
jgi:hypothetical protein